MWEIVGAIAICYAGYIVINAVAAVLLDRYRRP